MLLVFTIFNFYLYNLYLVGYFFIFGLTLNSFLKDSYLFIY